MLWSFVIKFFNLIAIVISEIIIYVILISRMGS